MEGPSNAQYFNLCGNARVGFSPIGLLGQSTDLIDEISNGERLVDDLIKIAVLKQPGCA